MSQAPSTTRRAVLGGLATATAAALAPRPTFARAAAPGLAFLTVGDWGRDGASHQREVAARMGERAAADAAAFVLSVGDNFYEDGVQSATDPQWRTSFEDVYTHPALQRPWYVALGNHDYRGVPQAQVEYARTSTRWRMPARYYVQSVPLPDGGHADLFVLDTSPMVKRYEAKHDGSPMQRNVEAQDAPAQLRWFAGALAASRADWKIVVAHHPVFSGGSGHGSTPELIADVKPLLEQYGVQLFVNGHDHDLQHIVVGPVTYVCTGAGSETRPVRAIAGTRFCSDRSGFTAYRIAGDTMRVGFVDWTGRELHAATVARARVTA